MLKYVKLLNVFSSFFLLVGLVTLIPFQVVASSSYVSGWGFSRNNTHQTPGIGKYQAMIEGTNSYYVGDPDKVYLTFDSGYDNGCLAPILDTLKEKNVKATFFVTGDFIKRFPELIIRMNQEGHIVANHSYSHNAINKISADTMLKDINKNEEAYYQLTKQAMVKYFRPPAGEFDRQSLLALKDAGYKTCFWSIAYFDWDVNKQLSVDRTYHSVIDNLHPGAIVLMHSVSKSNGEALGSIIDEISNQGYQFGLVTEL